MGLAWIQDRLPLFALMTVRLGGVFVVAPIFSSRAIPGIVRVWITLLLAATMLPLVDPPVWPTSVWGFATLVVAEGALGILLGFVVLAFLQAATYAGKLAGTHIGFGLANVVDPLTQDQATLLDQLNGFLTLVLFLALGGHRLLIEIVAVSFQGIPLGGLHPNAATFQGILELLVRMIVLGVQLAIPVLASVFLAEITVGVVSRGVPQFNVFSIGLTLRIVVGMIVFFLALPLTVSVMKRVIGTMPGEMQGLLVQLAP